MKKLIATAAASALAVGVLAGPSVGAASKTVQVKDNLFTPTKLTVTKGTTLRWAWKGKAPHNVTVTKGPVKFHSSTMAKGSFQKKLTKAGTYSILCTIHAPNMKMTVTVK
jgi:plastocyanin